MSKPVIVSYKNAEFEQEWNWHEYLKTSLTRKSKDSITWDATLHPGYIEVYRHVQKFCTGSIYEGKFNALGFSGYGIYRYPHGAVYKGYFKDGQFNGRGRISYPKGQDLKGIWMEGKLIDYQFIDSDGLVFSDPWDYCEFPNRMFQREIKEGLHPAGKEMLTNQLHSRVLSDGTFDTVDGYYDPSTKCIYSQSGKVLRIVRNHEEEFIKKHFRRDKDIPIGYDPSLYEFWTTGKRDELEGYLNKYHRRSVPI